MTPKEKWSKIHDPPHRLGFIQLVSPASGERIFPETLALWSVQGFHSISFPSEWGVVWVAWEQMCNEMFPFN